MSSRTSLCLSLTALTALTVSAAAPRAHACSPLPPGLYATIPAEGEQYPGNAALILQGQGISITDASVTVDGQPATLKDVSNAQLPGLGLLGVVVVPTPAAGQSVVITGTFCETGGGCPPVTLHYQATAADTTPPPPIDLVGFSIYDYPDFKSGGGDCQSDSDFAWFVQLKSQIPVQATDGAVIYSVEGYHDASLAGGPVVTFNGFVKDSGSPTVMIRRTAEVLQGKPLPEAICFRIKAYDTAGNTPAISPELYCKPCNYRVDSVPIEGFPSAEPMWTAADIYPGGPCDSTTTGTGTGGGGGGSAGDDVVIDGCGCRVGGCGDSASGLFGALVLALGASVRLARRRR